MAKGKPVKKDSSSNKTRTEMNKARKQTSRLLRAEKVKGILSTSTRKVLCNCGKEVKINKYKLKGDSYVCHNCRYPKKEDLNEKNQSVSQPERFKGKTNWSQGGRNRIN